MPLTLAEVQAAIDNYGEAARTEWHRLAELDKVVGGKHRKPFFETTAEERKYAKLWDSSTINLVGQTVSAYKQRLAVEGYRDDAQARQQDSTPWQVWLRSGMAARQKRLFAAALTHGYAYIYVSRADGEPGSVLKPMTGRQVFCHYEDPDDEWPTFALQVRGGVWRVWDDEQVWIVPLDRSGKASPLQVTTERHGTGVVPFSRLDCDWGAQVGVGLVVPLVPLNDMVNRITFVLNLIGENSSFALRVLSGVEPPRDDEGNPVEPTIGPNKMLLIPDPQGRMMQLDPTDPSGLLRWHQSLVEKFFSLAQLPPHYQVGQMANLSAEALVAAESTFAFALDDATKTFGLGVDRALRLGAAIAGDPESAGDVAAKVVWQPVQAKSLAAEVDAWGKAVTMLGVPEEATWERIPGVTRDDVERWREMKEREVAETAEQLVRAQAMAMMGGGEDVSGDGAPNAG